MMPRSVSILADASALTPQSAKPIPLVSAASKDPEDFELIPLKDRMRLFQERNNNNNSNEESGLLSKPVVSVPRTVSAASNGSNNKKSPKLPRAASASARYQSLDMDFEPESLTESIASSHTSSSTVISASKINNHHQVNSNDNNKKDPVVATYSWNDESNGEIYNDDQDLNEAGLYVVENGKEFPLPSVSQIKSVFLEREKKISSASMPGDILRGEPIILGRKETLEFHRQQQQHVELCYESSDDDDEDLDGTQTEYDTETDTVKSSQVPYIKEEQDVLSNIKVVKALKKKFTA